MSSYVESWEYGGDEYELGDTVEFKPPWWRDEDDWCTGEVVRVYNTRYNYHVLHGGERYSVDLTEMRRPR